MNFGRSPHSPGRRERTPGCSEIQEVRDGKCFSDMGNQTNVYKHLVLLYLTVSHDADDDDTESRVTGTIVNFSDIE